MDVRSGHRVLNDETSMANLRMAALGLPEVNNSARVGEGAMAMTNLTRWNPFREMEDLERRINQLFNFAFPTRQSGNNRESITVAEWTPAVDITEDDKEYLVKVELPEVKKDDVKVTVENGVLTISGERKFEKEDKGVRYHRIERSYGYFARSFSLPEDADAEKVSAEFKDGILKVHVAKSEKARPKQIEVKVE